MEIGLIRDAAAERLLSDPHFLSQWMQLYRACPWASPCQSSGFVTAWHEAYRDRYSPFIVSQYSEAGDLIGLISLATDKKSGQLTVAGGRQAEYKTWLALPSNGSSFIEAALAELASKTDVSALSFRYLPPGTPTDWIARCGKRSGRCQLQRHPRPIIPVGDTAAVTEYLQKKKSGKSVRNSFNRLKRIGNLTLEEIRDAEQLQPIFDQLITFYDIRQGGAHGKFAFQQDLAKKPFHLALLKTPGLLHVTVLRAGREILSAQFGISDGKVFSGAMPIISPFHAAHSPMQVHVLMLVEKLHQDGYSTFDLTASMDPFKERFVASYDSVCSLTVYFRHHIRHQVVQASQAIARRSLRSLRIEPHAALEQLQNFTRVPMKSWPSVLARNSFALLKKPLAEKKFKIYALLPKQVPPLDGEVRMCRDHLADLLAFQPTEAWLTRQRFIAAALRRIEAGDHFYTRVENGRLVHISWLIEDQKSNIFPETGQEFPFPPGAAVLFGSYTDPKWRRHHLWWSALQQMLHDLVQNPKVSHIFTAVPAANQPARHVIERAGFVSVP
jgi:CelD/BcsL family acetyltransferase involved in cellulose biosynthesis/RimJ/RimL family protein N-acetyltransferase